MLRFVVALAYLIVASSAARGAHSHVDGFDQRQLRDWSPSFPHYSPTTSEDKPVYVPTDKKEDKPVYVPTDRTEDKPVYTPTCSGKKCDAPVYVPTYSMPVDPPSDDKPVYSPVTKTNKPTLSPTYEPTKMLTLIPTPAPTNRQPTKYPPTGASVAPTPRPTNSPSENPLTPSNPTANPAALTDPTAPVAIPIPTTAVPTLDAPSELPSSAPSSTPAVAFINELGITNGIGFVEVAYSSFLGPGIETYSIAIYNGVGSLIRDDSLSEGINSVNGLTFTFITYLIAEPPDDAEAFALVDNSDMTVLFFLSDRPRVTAIDGPAKGMQSVNVQSINRNLQNFDGDASFALSGSGCDFADFVFTEVESTPGDVNAGQEVAECKSPPTAAPTPPPTPLPTEKISSDSGFPEGAIIGIAVGGTVLSLLCLILVSDFRTNRKKSRASQEPMYWEEGSINSEASFSDE